MAQDVLPGLEDPPGGISSDEWAATPPTVRSLVRGLLADWTRTPESMRAIVRSLLAGLGEQGAAVRPVDVPAPATGNGLEAAGAAERAYAEAERPSLLRIYEATSYLWLGLLGAIIVLLLRFYKLDSLQNEMYDDIGFAYDYVNRVRRGERPYNFVLSTGPLFHYLATPFTWLFGLNYFALKVATVVLSLVTIWGTFGLARRLLDDRFALIAAFITGISSWMLIFSRIGNLIIMYPLLTALTLWLLARSAQSGRRRDIIGCGVVAALGLYTHPSTFFLPVAVGVAYLCLLITIARVRWTHVLLYSVTVLVTAIPFLLIVKGDPDTFFGSYIGGKLVTRDDVEGTLLGNFQRALLALHVRGDDNFRSNPAQLPHLDPLSGLLFLGGLVFWLRRDYRRMAPLLLVPLLILQIPATLVISRPGEVPSASRTFGIAPIAYILVASGLYWLVDVLGRQLRERSGLQPRLARLLPAGVAIALLAVILNLNANRYFDRYIAGLPYENTPIGRHIADYIETLPPDTQAYMVGCCWEHGMPEIGTVPISLAKPERVTYLDSNALTCDQLASLPLPAVLIWNFHKQIPGPQTAPCVVWMPSQIYASPRGLPLFRAAPLIREPLTPDQVAGIQMVDGEVDLEGTIVAVRHSELDQGGLYDLFDTSFDTLIRGASANPLVLEFTFPTPRNISALGFDFATMDSFQIDVELTPADGGAPVLYTQNFSGLPADPHVDFPLPQAVANVQKLKLSVRYFSPPPGDVHIHVRGLQIR